MTLRTKIRLLIMIIFDAKSYAFICNTFDYTLRKFLSKIEQNLFTKHQIDSKSLKNDQFDDVWYTDFV